MHSGGGCEITRPGVIVVGGGGHDVTRPGVFCSGGERDLTHPDVIVIGGGLQGCSTALQLALRGRRVLVLEKDHAGRHASGVNAGGVRRLGRHFAEIPLSCAAMELWHRIGELVDDECGFERCGQVKVAENEDELAQLARRVDAVRALGFAHEELVGREELRALVPAIAEHCVGAILCRSDGAALPFRTTLAFRRKAERLGAQFREGERVTHLRQLAGTWRVETATAHFEAPMVVNAAGAWAHGFAAQVGEPVPLEVIAPMLMITEPVAPFLRPVVGAAGRALSFKQFANGTVMIGGGHRGRADPGSNGTDLDFRRLAISAQTVSALFPQMAAVRIVRAWAGIEARMPDDIPVLGPSSTCEGLWHAFGFSAHGFQLGPIVGSIIADLVTTGRTPLPIEAFAISRFKQLPAG